MNKKFQASKWWKKLQAEKDKNVTSKQKLQNRTEKGKIITLEKNYKAEKDKVITSSHPLFI